MGMEIHIKILFLYKNLIALNFNGFTFLSPFGRQSFFKTNFLLFLFFQTRMKINNQIIIHIN